MSERGANVGLVFDVGRDAGLGHRHRMRALGAALGSRGVNPELIEADGRQTSREVLFVDSYRWRADDPRVFDAPVVAAIDDLKRNLAVDLLVDCAPDQHHDIRETATRSLHGLQYALVDPTLRTLPRRPVADVQSILVASGGGDDTGAGPRIALDLRGALPDSITVRLAVGPWSTPPNVRGVDIVSPANGLGEQLAAADIVVTAGGVTMLESLSLGRPTIALVLHDNQRAQAEAAAEAGAVLLSDVAGAIAAVVGLARSAPTRRMLGIHAAALVDGKGSIRVAEALIAVAANHLRCRSL